MFSSALRAKLVELLIDFQPATTFNAEYDPAECADAILVSANFALDEFSEGRDSLTKQDLKAECHSTWNTLAEAERKLRSLSPEFDRLLPVESDPLGCADTIRRLNENIDAASDVINSMPAGRPRAAEFQRYIAKETAVRVLHTLAENGLPTSITYQDDHQYTSLAVEVLKGIGEDIGLCYSPQTWRDIASEAKRDNRI